MRNISRYVVSHWRPRTGARVTAVEFGMIAGLIALMIASSVSLLGPALHEWLNFIAGKV